MKVEGVVRQGNRIGSGEIKLGIKDNSFTVILTGRPRPRKKEDEGNLPSPMEGVEITFPLSGRNLKNLVRMAVEAKDNLIKKALGKRDEIGFDEKLSNKGEYLRIRGQAWAFTLLARSGDREAFLVMKPKEFYPMLYLAENYVKGLPEYSAIITKDLDVLICTAKKGEGLSFRTVETDGELERITDKAALTALFYDLNERARIEGMYPVKFGNITLVEKKGQPYIRIRGRYYKTDRQGLLTLQLLTRIAVENSKAKPPKTEEKQGE